MFKTIKNAIKTPDVRKRLLYTLLLVVIFRLGCYITVPGVDSVILGEIMQSSGNGLSNLIDIVSGGALSRFSLFAMSIYPYITASIVVQLLSWVIPSLEKMIKEGGEEGKAKMNFYTKLVTLVLAIAQGLGTYLMYRSSGIFVDTSFLTGFIVVLSLVAGTAILMWLGEQITSKGVGNGTSMIIFAGIVAGLPGVIKEVLKQMVTENGFSTQGLLVALGITIGAIILVAAVVFVTQAERRVPVQYAKKVVGRKMYGGQNTHIPIKLVMAGVMPVIFASSFMTFPSMIIPMFNREIATATGFWAGVYKFSLATSSTEVPVGYSIANAIVYLILIVAFTFFYSYASYNPAEMSGNIKRNGGFIPGIRAGKPTTEFISSIMKKLNWFGAVFLAIIAILPMLLRFTGLNLTFGGTTILIVVGVAIEMVQQLESLLVMRHYKGFLE